MRGRIERETSFRREKGETTTQFITRVAKHSELTPHEREQIVSDIRASLYGDSDISVDDELFEKLVDTASTPDSEGEPILDVEQTQNEPDHRTRTNSEFSKKVKEGHTRLKDSSIDWGLPHIKRSHIDYVEELLEPQFNWVIILPLLALLPLLDAKIPIVPHPAREVAHYMQSVALVRDPLSSYTYITLQESFSSIHLYSILSTPFVSAGYTEGG